MDVPARRFRRAFVCLSTLVAFCSISLPAAASSIALVEWLIEVGDYDAAMDAHAELSVEMPGDTRLTLLKGVILQRTGRWAEAEPIFESLLGSDVDDTARRSLVAVLSQQARADQTPVEVRRQSNQRVVELVSSAQSPSIPLLHARALAHEGLGELAPALDAFDQVLDGSNAPVDVVHHVADLCLRAGQPQRGLDALSKVARPSSETAKRIYNLSVELFQQGQFPAAESGFRSAITIDPNQAPFHRLLGMSLLKLDREDEAKQFLRRFVELDPTSPEAKKLIPVLEEGP